MLPSSMLRTGGSHKDVLSEIELESPTNLEQLTMSFASFQIHDSAGATNRGAFSSDSREQLNNSGLAHDDIAAFARSGMRSAVDYTSTQTRAAPTDKASVPSLQSPPQQNGLKRMRDSGSNFGASALASSSRQLFAAHVEETRRQLQQTFQYQQGGRSQSSALHSIISSFRGSASVRIPRNFGKSGDLLSLQPAQLPLPMQFALQRRMLGFAPLSDSLTCVSGCAIVSGTALTLLASTCIAAGQEAKPHAALLLQVYNDFANGPVGELLVNLAHEPHHVAGAFAPGGTGQCVVAAGRSVLLLDLASSWSMYQDSHNKSTQTITAWSVGTNNGAAALHALPANSRAPVAPGAPACGVAALSGCISQAPTAGRSLLVALGHPSGDCSVLHLSGSGEEVSPADLQVSMTNLPMPRAAHAASSVRSVHLAPLQSDGYFAGGVLLTVELCSGSQFQSLFIPQSGTLLQAHWTRIARERSAERAKPPGPLQSASTQAVAGAAAGSQAAASWGSVQLSRVVDVALSSSDAQQQAGSDQLQQEHAQLQDFGRHLRGASHGGASPAPPVAAAGSLGSTLHSAAGLTPSALHLLTSSHKNDSVSLRDTLLLGSPTIAGRTLSGVISSGPQQGAGGVFANSFFLADSSSSYETDFPYGMVHPTDTKQGHASSGSSGDALSGAAAAGNAK